MESMIFIYCERQNLHNLKLTTEKKIFKRRDKKMKAKKIFLDER